MRALGDEITKALIEFHDAYGIPRRACIEERPAEWALRRDLLAEEWQEYLAAIETTDVAEIADALADMAYVIFGTALSYGIDLPAVLAEVHRSNMSKLGLDGKPILRGDGKVLKGPNFSPPDIEPLLFRKRIA